MGGMVALEVGLTNREPMRSAILYSLLASEPCSVGELIDFARGIPAEWVESLAIPFWEAVRSEGGDGEKAALRRRQLVILATLFSRLAFEVEGIPQDRRAEI